MRPKLEFTIPVLITKSPFLIPSKRINIARILDYIESYFSWSGRFYKLVSGIHSKDKKYIVLNQKKIHKHVIIKFITLVSYFTILLPIVILILKLIQRKINKFELIEMSKSEINYKNISKKPIPFPVPSSNLTDLQPNDVCIYAESLNLDKKHLIKIKEVFDGMHASDENLVWSYMRAILFEFNNNEMISTEFKKDILINIARDSGDDTCNEGKLTKIQKEYARLFGLNDKDINQIILTELHDLKIEILNQIATEIIPRDIAFHPHFISAAHVYASSILGLEKDVGELDPLHTSSRVRPWFAKNKIHVVINRFYEFYIPETIIDWLYPNLNGKKDREGITLNLGIFYKHIENHLKETTLPCPKSFRALRKGNLHDYLDSDSDNYSLKDAYEIALGNYISEKYFKKTNDFDGNQQYDLDCELIKEINKEGIEFILKSIGIFEN